jgi:hypothetical protein
MPAAAGWGLNLPLVGFLGSPTHTEMRQLGKQWTEPFGASERLRLSRFRLRAGAHCCVLSVWKSLEPWRDITCCGLHLASKGECEPYQDSSDDTPNVVGRDTLVTAHDDRHDGHRSGFHTDL